MALEWLSNVWKSKRVDPQLYKFTPQYTYDINVQNFNNFFDRLSEFSYAKEAVSRVNQQRTVDLSFIDSEIKTLENITIPTPKFISYERVGKRVQPWEIATRPYSYGSGGGVRRWWIENPEKKRIYNQQVAEFDTYKSNALSQISDNLKFLTQKRSLIPSEPFSL